MRSRLFRCLAAPALALLLVSGSARAQQASGAVDCAGAFNDAGTLRDEHKLREARARYLVCAQPVCPSFIRLCVGAAQEVAAAIPSVVFTAKTASGVALVDVAVSMDGTPLASTLSGTSIEVDPGKHVFVFTAPGYEPVTRELVVVEGKKDQVESVTLSPVAQVVVPPPAPPAPSPPPASSTVAPAVRGTETSSPPWQKPAAVAIGGGGIVALGIGSAFGATAASTWTRAKTECVPGACGAGSQAQKDHDAAQTDATVSTALFVVGGVAAVGGVLLWFLAPGPATGSTALRVTPLFGPAQAGVGMGGVF